MTALLRELQARTPPQSVPLLEHAASDSRALAPLVRVETLRTAREASGSTHVDLALRLTPEGIRGFAPHYAEYLRKYLTPMQAKGAVEDFAGNVWWRLEAAANLWTLRLRVRDGRLVLWRDLRPARYRQSCVSWSTTTPGWGPSAWASGAGGAGDAHATPVDRDSWPASSSLRNGAFPSWSAHHSGSLHHPFEGPGSEIAWALRAQPAGPTLLVGRYRHACAKAGWCAGWAVSPATPSTDFRRGAEEEADRYNRDCLLALRDDLTALVR